MSATTLFKGSSLGLSTCLRLKASNWRVSELAWASDFWMCSDRLVVGIPRRQAAVEQIAVAQDGLHEIVEIVRDAAGQTPDRLHLLRLPVLVLQALAFGNVAHDDNEHDRAAAC